jgi:aspartyl-tRNA(Asn)/glutamyl-tRNA(Gln) amidotransferase subunit A
VVAGYDADDPFSSNVPAHDYVTPVAEGISGWRVAVAAGRDVDDADPEVLHAVRAAARVLEDLGAIVNDVELGQLREAAHANGVMTTSDAAAFHHERLRRAPEDFGADVRDRLCRGATRPTIEYVEARRTQSLLRRQFQRWFLEHDVAVMPTTPTAAPVRDGLDAVEAARQLTRLTAPFNLTGLPALSLPCGFTRDGLPIGLQIVGPPWGEARVLRAGCAYEQATAWHARTPTL